MTDYTVPAFLAGVLSGSAITWLSLRPGKPLRLRRRYEYVPPARIATPPPFGHDDQCKVWLHRFILFAETVAAENGKPPGRLPSYRELAAAAGTTWRPFEWYLDVLRDGEIVDVRGRGGVWWAVGKAGRRAALSRLPYPDTRPPRFPFDHGALQA